MAANAPNPEPDRPDAPKSVGEHNIERLLMRAYAPEEPNAAFASQLEAEMVAEARRQAGLRRQAAGRTTRLLWARRLGVVAAAVLVGFAVGLLLRINGGFRAPQGRVGQADATAGRVRPAVPSPLVVHAPQGAPVPVENLLCPQPLAAPPAAEFLPVGGSLATPPGEPNRVELPDGSVLYVNAGSLVRLTGPRAVAIDRGELYAEARRVGQSAPDGTRIAAPFTVVTPHRTITAKGTHFGVRVTEGGVGVMVSQGKVTVTGFPGELEAGQQLRPDRARAFPMPRATHVLDWARELMGSASAPLVPASRHAGGSLVARLPDAGGQEAKLTLRRYHVDVHVEDGFARTTIDQTYFNHLDQRLEGTFYFPLPADASISRLAMYVNGKLMEGGMAERQHARSVFETIVAKMKDPALLEWIDGTTFKMRIFPLEGRQEKRIVLSYTQRLEGLYGRQSYRFPAGHSMSKVGKWSFQARIRHGAAWAWQCESHKLAAEADGGDLLLRAEAANVSPDTDIVLRLDRAEDAAARAAAADEAGPRAAFSTAEHEDARYLMLRFRPELPGAPRRQKRHWVFLFESSADRDPLLARTQVEIVRGMLRNADDGDTFHMLTAGTRVRLLAEEPLATSRANVERAIGFLDRAQLIGALDLEQALDAAGKCAAGRPGAHLVHLGSALPALGERSQAGLLERIPAGVTYVGVGVGKRWSRDFMKAAAKRTGGYLTQINPDENITWRAFDLVATLDTPRLMGVTVRSEPDGRELLLWADAVSQGEELCAVLRQALAEPLPPVVTVRGTLDGAAWSAELSVRDAAPQADYLPRTWARLEIERLLAEDPARHHQRIVELSKAMYVMSPFTSLLVLENEAMYAEYNVDRGRKDHWAMYPCPETIPVVHEPLDGKAPRGGVGQARPGPTGGAAAWQPAVLRSILVRLAVPFLQPAARPQSAPSRETHRTAVLTAWHVRPDIHAVQFPMTVDYDGDSGTGGAIRRRGLGGEAGGEVGPVELPAGQWLAWSYDAAGLGKLRMSGRARKEGDPAPGLGYPDLSVSSVGGHVVLDGNSMLVVPADGGTLSLGGQAVRLNGGSMRLVGQPFGLHGGLEFVGGGAYGLDTVGSTGGERVGFSVADWSGRLFVGLQGQVVDSAGTLILGDGRWGLNAGAETPPVRIVTGTSGSSRPDGDWLHTGLDLMDSGNGRLGDAAITLVPSVSEAAPPPGYRPPRRSRSSGIFGSDAESTAMMVGGGIFGGLAWGGQLNQVIQAPLAGDLGRAWEVESDRVFSPARAGADGAFFEEEEQPRRSRRPPTAEEAYAEDFVRMIMGAIDPDSWGDPWGGAPGTGFAQVFNGHLVVRQTAENHQALAELIDKIRQAGGRGEATDDWGWPAAAAIRRAPAAGRADARGGDWGDDWLGDARPAGGYQRPAFSGCRDWFTDLTLYAPGLQTTWADVAAVLENEGPEPQRPRRGRIDEAARGLIDAARSAGWQDATFLTDANEVLTVTFDGAGRLAMQRRLDSGLVERTTCDGRELLHAYDEIGLVACRPLSRFHREQIRRLIPWLLPPAENLAAGADVMLAADRTVVVAPHAAADGAAATTGRLELDFADGGRLAERRAFGADGRIALRETFDADGTCRVLDGKGRVLAERKYDLRPARPPRLDVDESKLLVLPMPLRPAQHALASRGLDRLWAGGWPADAALAYVASALLGDDGYHRRQGRDVLEARFLNAGDRRAGWSVLLAAAGFDAPAPAGLPADHPLTAYLAAVRQGSVPGEYADIAERYLGPRGSEFLPRMLGFQCLWRRRDTEAVRGNQAGAAEAWRRDAVDYVHRTGPTVFSWALLVEAAPPTGAPNEALFQYRVMDAFELFRASPALAPYARYEAARALYNTGNGPVAAAEFARLYDQMRRRGLPLWFDEAMYQATKDGRWREVMLGAAEELVKSGRRGAAVGLAWQCALAGDRRLGEQILALARAAAPQAEQPAMSLAAVKFHCHAGQWVLAEQAMDVALRDPQLAEVPELWRAAARLAARRGQLARVLLCEDRALALVCRGGTADLDLGALRARHAELLAGYERLAMTVAPLSPPPELLAGIIGAADRWRSFDPDPKAACHAAARVLRRLAAEETAWEYLTTPLAAGPFESGPWAAMAQELGREGAAALADRAYATAFDLDPTNARLLWDRAQLLQSAGNLPLARELYQQIAQGRWNPTHSTVQYQARRVLETMP